MTADKADFADSQGAHTMPVMDATLVVALGGLLPIGG